MTVDLDGTHDVSVVARRRTELRTVRRGLVPRILSVAFAPLRMAGAVMGRSPALRRLGMRIVIIACILAVIAGSVGVILLNNVVIGRTAELGELDDRRRELRRENALLNADKARLSASDIVVRKAAKKLGMTDSGDMPRYIFLQPDSRALTDQQRALVAARERKRVAILAARRAAAAKAEADVAKATPTSTAKAN